MKLLVALFALMLLIAGSTWWMTRGAPEPAACDVHDLSQTLSPDGRTQADLFEVRCGEAVTTHVALRAARAPVYGRGDVFIALGSEPVRVAWDGPQRLRLESPAARVLAQETRWRDVTVRILSSR